MDEPATSELLEHYRPIFRAAFEAASFGEPLTWDVTWAVTQTPQGPMTQFMVYCHVAAVAPIGALLQRVFSVPIGASEQQINAIVAGQCSDLKLHRSKTLAAANNKLNATGKLILPN